MPTGFESGTFTNEVVLKKNGQEYAKDASVNVKPEIGLDGVLKKEVVDVQSTTGKVHWKVIIDLSKTPGVENLVFKDWCRARSYMTFLQDETVVAGTEVSYHVSYTASEMIDGEDSRSMTISFKGTVQNKIVITYTTRIDPVAFGSNAYVKKQTLRRSVFHMEERAIRRRQRHRRMPQYSEDFR